MQQVNDKIPRESTMTGNQNLTLLKIVSRLFLIVIVFVGGCADEPAKTTNKSTDQNIITEFVIPSGGDPVVSVNMFL